MICYVVHNITGMNNSSFIHPLRDSFTGLSVGFPALDIDLTINVSFISSL